MLNEVFNTVIQFIAEHFGDAAAMTVGNGFVFNIAMPLAAVAIGVLNVLGVM